MTSRSRLAPSSEQFLRDLPQDLRIVAFPSAGAPETAFAHRGIKTGGSPRGSATQFPSRLGEHAIGFGLVADHLGQSSVDPLADKLHNRSPAPHHPSRAMTHRGMGIGFVIDQLNANQTLDDVFDRFGRIALVQQAASQGTGWSRSRVQQPQRGFPASVDVMGTITRFL